MKALIFIFGLFFTLTAFARPVEVECTGRNISVAVEQAFSPGSFRRAAAATSNQSREFTVSARGWFANRIRYEGLGFDLDVDYWPDQRPQWGRFYRGTFRSSEMNIPASQLSCRFPNLTR